MRTDLQPLLDALPTAGIASANRLGLALAPGLDRDTWRGLVAHVTRLVVSSGGTRQTLTAWLGDALAYGGAQGRGLITECASATGINPGTLRNAKMVCTRIPVSCRHDALSWTHHCEVGLAFDDSREIERWLVVAEAEGLSAMALRRRVRAYVASARDQTSVHARPDGAALKAFRVMRELRACDRLIDRERAGWRQWSPGTAQFALRELAAVTGFVDTLRVRALESAASRPRDLSAN